MLFRLKCEKGDAISEMSQSLVDINKITHLISGTSNHITILFLSIRGTRKLKEDSILEVEQAKKVEEREEENRATKVILNIGEESSSHGKERWRG